MTRIALARLILSAAILLSSNAALANWTLNLGYHNPPNATVGLNLLYFSNNWAFEIGLGYVDSSTSTDDEDDDDDTNTNASATEDEEESITVRASGGLNLKFFLGSGGIKPYAQIGVGAGIGAKTGDEGGLGAGVGGGYGGLGIFAGKPSLYIYGSYNLSSNENSFIQLGLGFDI